MSGQGAPDRAEETPRERADAHALPDGLKLNEYEIERTLGVGGFGITYLARDCNLQLPVAIKEYFPGDLVTRDAWRAVQMRAHGKEHRQQFDSGLARFLDEARALATFRHPNIIRVLRYFLDNGTGYIVMEYESGQPLKRWVPHHAPLSQRAVLSIVQPLLDGLELVHKAGFLHRDIKPDNIYVRADNTPVLLDFGSARRVQADRDMTNIISPGFAPFEQYHSHGNQGPWTDIYSMGAVMYWMVTGKKPMESAARVKTDTMLPASQLADAAVFGQPLLEAIDWAVTPEEEKRPQTVAQFRAAMQGAPVIDLPTDAAAPAQGGLGIAPAPHAPSQPLSQPISRTDSSSSQKRNVLGTVLCLDLVDYGKRKVDDQAALKKLFNQLVAKALRGIAPEGLITLDTGSGAAVCFTGDPEEALNSALLLRDLLEQRYKSLVVVRTGIHMGPVRVMQDLNQHVNVIGDGISVAQRVSEFAHPGQVLVSRSYYDVISRITDDTSEMFMYLGQFEDKHGRLHEVYSVGSGERTTRRGSRTAPGEAAEAPAGPSTADDEAVHEVEVELARHIGPLARVLVGKARPLATTIQELREAVAPTIQEPRLRELFLSGHRGHSHTPNSQSTPLSRPRSTSQAASTPAPAKAADVVAEELAAMEATLSRFIGPMARIVVKKEAGRSASFKDLVASLAGNVDNLAEREKFMADLHKALPRRSFR